MFQSFPVVLAATLLPARSTLHSRSSSLAPLNRPMTVLFNDNDDALGQRMLDNVMLSSQEGARVRLFVNTVADSAPLLSLT